MNYNEFGYHPTSEKVVEILCNKTQNPDPMFFRICMAYYWGLVATQMRVKIRGWDKNDLPINIYAINLSPSGTGKGFSTNLIENEVLGLFRHQFMEYTFPAKAEITLDKVAHDRAVRNNRDFQEERDAAKKEFDQMGSPLFNFDSATTPAIKQMRHKLLMAGAGGLNLQIDEVGANLVGQTEPLYTFLELYDLGRVKDKLIKSSAENMRFDRVEGSTPANMLLFGTPSKLFDGALTENQFMDMLTMGYARRCFFGFSRVTHKKAALTPEEVFAQMMDTASNHEIDTIATKIAALADINNMDQTVMLSKEVALELITYKMDCEARGREFTEHEEVRKMEMDHRYFKVMKLAGAYAFADGAPEITIDHIHYAIRLAEDSGEAFAELVTPERPYMKLANYLASSRNEVTLADLDSDLPYFRGGKAAKDDIINMAIAHGYKNNIIIKKSFSDGIMFLRGETLQKTDLNNLIFSISGDMTRDYDNITQPWEKLGVLGSTKGYHWVSHHLERGYRKEENAIPGFNLLVLDVDGTYPLEAAKRILDGYKALFYTTKSHTNESNSYRIIIPMSHTLYLDRTEYKEFIHNVYESLPFELDEQGDHRCKKWLTHDGMYEYIGEEKGILFDVLPFIPKTKKNEERKELIKDQGSMEALDRWFINNIGDGNRNNQLHKYARILADKGMDFAEVRKAVISLNDKIADKLTEDEINSTIMKTVAQNM